MIHNKLECTQVFEGFKFGNLQSTDPPDEKGVYVIRVVRKGKGVAYIINRTRKVLSEINWPILTEKVTNRLDRLKEIDECPYIYIGSAGTRGKSQHTLRGRYGDFVDRHTVMYPLWALLYFDWKLEYGWFVCKEPGPFERELKLKYQRCHKNRLPALVSR